MKFLVCSEIFKSVFKIQILNNCMHKNASHYTSEILNKIVKLVKQFATFFFMAELQPLKKRFKTFAKCPLGGSLLPSIALEPSARAGIVVRPHLNSVKLPVSVVPISNVYHTCILSNQILLRCVYICSGCRSDGGHRVRDQESRPVDQKIRPTYNLLLNISTDPPTTARAKSTHSVIVWQKSEAGGAELTTAGGNWESSHVRR